MPPMLPATALCFLALAAPADGLTHAAVGKVKAPVSFLNEISATKAHWEILKTALGRYAHTALQALRLIGSGLFDEFPGLQIVLGHLGERIPFDMWRIDNLMKQQWKLVAAAPGSR